MPKKLAGTKKFSGQKIIQASWGPVAAFAGWQLMAYIFAVVLTATTVCLSLTPTTILQLEFGGQHAALRCVPRA